jgi:hypothetical protein
MAISLPPIGALQSRGFAAEPTKARGQVLAAGAPRAPHNDGRGLAALGQGLASIGDTIKQSRQKERRDAMLQSVFGGQDDRNAAMANGGGPTNAAAAQMSSPIDRLVSKGVPQNIAEMAALAWEAGDGDAAWEVAGPYLLAPPAERKVIQGADGYSYYQDNGERVLPGVKKETDYNKMIISGPDGQPMVNPVYLAARKDIAAAGRSNVSVKTGDVYDPARAADETYGSINTEELTKIPTALNQVNENALAYSELERAMDSGAIQGPFAESRLLLGSIGQMIGIPDLAENVSSTEQMRSITNRLAPGLRPEGSGPMSDADLKLFLNSLPNIGITEGGNRKILGYLNKINRYQGQVLKAKREFLSKRENFGASPYELSKYVNQRVKSPFTANDREFFGSVVGGQKADTIGNTQVQTPGLESRGQMGGRPSKDWSQADDADLKKELGL